MPYPYFTYLISAFITSSSPRLSFKFDSGEAHPVLNYTSRHEYAWISSSIAPSILKIRIRWRSVIRFTPRSLYSLEKSPRYPFTKTLVRLHNLFGSCGENRNLCCWRVIEARFIGPVHRAFNISSEISQLVLRF